MVKQDLTDLDVDVIVNAADANLKLEGGLALVIGQKGQIHSFIYCNGFDQILISKGIKVLYLNPMSLTNIFINIQRYQYLPTHLFYQHCY